MIRTFIYFIDIFIYFIYDDQDFNLFIYDDQHYSFHLVIAGLSMFLCPYRRAILLLLIYLMTSLTFWPLTDSAGSSLIPAQSSLTWTEYFIPQRAGSSRLMASLDCAALRQVDGTASVTIAGRSL